MTPMDERHMRHALTLAARGLGRTGRAPSVGCVIVAPDGHIIALGRTAESGRPHAEAAALAQAGGLARGATVYVSLEPCAHVGQSGPPCADALARAKVARVVVAMTDPDPRTNGRGMARIREAGIEVTTGVLESEAMSLNRGFSLRVLEERPLVTLKLAQSADGFTARAPDEDPWITGEEARRFGQLLRAQHDAILVGVETVLADDPELTCRIPGLEKYSPQRVVLDSRLRLSPHSKLAQTARQVPTLVFTTSDGGDELRAMGVEIVRSQADADGRILILPALKKLAERGVMRLLVEGGATVANSFLRAGFADRLEIFTAPMLLGNAGRHGSGPLTVRNLNEAPNFMRVSSRSFGGDRLETYEARS
ncbi:MAG TPA: bifunctional diaminohydroxyphosphoribosylaminopyrimidine deaminase/5-amino-6-(5-phosphoribosylamino)uracil reductase RibD [Rhizomicrobium sp.]|nr:bifunctional diaminohydroxyphosphoribosylaminopyrimidine deaminase/5-amino-6-(5-phosphoribosylamino)uracil reductase RibD [Rhizomicrobium sp.]